MFATLWEEFSGRGFSTLLGLLIGASITWFIGRWKRHRQRQSILLGDARDTVVIALHLLEKASNKPPVLRIRSLGQDELNRVVPNGHLASVLLDRAFAVSARDTLISMVGAEGSYLLETLTNFVSTYVGNEPFEHDLYVMAPCCEPAALAQHQPITILLIAAEDLKLFLDWTVCRDIRVEHHSDGARILTLMELARRHQKEQAELDRLRQAGQRTRFVETMYTLDLALDKRAYPIPTKHVSWGRFEDLLRELNLETEKV